MSHLSLYWWICDISSICSNETQLELWCFLFNKIPRLIPKTNNTWRKLRSLAFQRYKSLGVVDRVFLLKYYAFLGTTIRWPLSIEGGLNKKKTCFFLPAWLGRGMAMGLQSNSCPLQCTPLVHSAGPGRVNINCPTLLSTSVVLLCPDPDQLMVTAHWRCGQSKTWGCTHKKLL